MTVVEELRDPVIDELDYIRNRREIKTDSSAPHIDFTIKSKAPQPERIDYDPDFDSYYYENDYFTCIRRIKN